MSQEIGAQLLHYHTASELWNNTCALTSAFSRSRVMVYPSELHHMRKKDMRMDDYLAKMKNIADQFVLAGAPIFTDELILHTLNGLDAEYNAIVVKLIDLVDLPWIDAQGSLRAFKSRRE
ncbi:hypothetical protein QN277_007561 [Acacia crassicarpa]|uniref:Uncharacterized protein n=1 Tax=Acacia crassicarpa TaxID=499986 RepID=A0AAE1MAL5_9FABA|nr:hypothetical protein QN277_007561 [Acacia crassicarpa]